MKNINFIIKAVSLVLIAGILLIYSLIAADRQKQLKEYENKAAEIEAHNAEVLSLLEAAKYKDGVYEGSAHGYRGDITVKVTVEGGAIADIEILSADKDDRAYVARAHAMIERILAAQSAEVDAVSGATFSSNGIKNAVIEALKAAEG